VCDSELNDGETPSGATPDRLEPVQADRGFQVAAATLSVERKSVTCGVVGEDWPAWLSTARSLVGNASVSCCCGDVEVASLLEIKHCDWASLEGRQDIEGLWERVDLVLVSGSGRFFKMLGGWDVDFSKALASLDGRGRQRRVPKIQHLSWHRGSHGAVGGATDFTAWLGVGASVPIQAVAPIGRGIRRTVGDY